MSPPDPGDTDRELVAELAEQISQRAEVLRRRIDALAQGPVQVVAVTKGHPAVVAAAAIEAGFTALGENYAQELRDKAPLVGGAEWHFIGRLQTNKVRLIAESVSVWQSLDRESAIDAVAKRAPGADVMIQVDLAGMEGRGGCERAEVPRLVERAVESGLSVLGLMGVGPADDPEDSRPGFHWLAREAASLGLPEVSMGMSADLDVALSEGSTMVRVGSALVGPRPPR